ncbi:hypothetical protein [Actinacidiphila glaucinigra]|uniref:hypothetical protein n=1 Tax=Actinacidiphila glaucinigra TaxID=235986 RepID=UPI003716D771
MTFSSGSGSTSAATRRIAPGLDDHRAVPVLSGSVLLHENNETAVHVGHLDAVRELFVGRQWIVLDG